MLLISNKLKFYSDRLLSYKNSKFDNDHKPSVIIWSNDDSIQFIAWLKNNKIHKENKISLYDKTLSVYKFYTNNIVHKLVGPAEIILRKYTDMVLFEYIWAFEGELKHTNGYLNSRGTFDELGNIRSCSFDFSYQDYGEDFYTDIVNYIGGS